MKRPTQAKIDYARCWLAARVAANGEGYTALGVATFAFKMEAISAFNGYEQGKLKSIEVAETLRQAALRGGSLTYRDGEIVCMLAELRRLGFPLFPGRETRQEGQVYACELIIEEFEKSGIEIPGIPGLEKIWRIWVRGHPEIRTIFQK
jgi:hypothetical protein